MKAKKDAAMRVPPAALVSVSSKNGGERGGRLPVQFCKIAKEALMDYTGGVLGSFLKMKKAC